MFDMQAVVSGLAASEPVPDYLCRVLEVCGEALQKRGRGEDKYLHPLWRRLECRRNPAQDATQAFQQGGMEALIQLSECK